MMSRNVVLAAVLAVAWTAQDQRPPFRTGVELIQREVHPVLLRRRPAGTRLFARRGVDEYRTSRRHEQ